VIIAPVITEKSMANRQANVYTFKVVKDATKTEIKNAVEEAFKVSVKNVNTLNTKSKRRRVGKYAGRTKTYKKAIVTLAEGSVIEI
ncbi:MAG: 50S ribosomal protein L23, partial [bacterium]|nr:50S ribosomal protein L23 [bacterium]